MSSLVVTPPDGDVTSKVREIFAQVTRYPLEILAPDASLEEDLGIDSVKLGEVFAVMRETYSLPEKMDIPREKLRTIASISEVLQEYLRPASAVSSGQQRVTFSDAGDLCNDVRDIFASVTRYPLEVLDLNASLEEDLGIDSVKLGEVFAVMRERYALPEKMDISREETKTIGRISDALAKYLGNAAMTASAAPALNGHMNGGGAGSAKADIAAIANGNGAHIYSNESASVVSSEAVKNSFAALSPERKPFAGKIALVTGSGRAMGKDLALYLAELGASVVVNSFHSRPQGEETVEEIRAAGGKAVHAWGSVANPEHVKRIFDLVADTYGGLDFLICNASNGLLAPLEEIGVEHWEKAFRTNVVGLHQCSLKALELMKKRGGGKIITMSSPAAHDYVDYFGCMGAVKAAVENLTKSMAVEYARYNVQVNCVSPGPVYGDLLDKWPESKRLTAEFEKATVYERMCEARDVSHFIAYLLSDPVKLFTGSVLVMDGGVCVKWPSHRAALAARGFSA